MERRWENFLTTVFALCVSNNSFSLRSNNFEYLTCNCCHFAGHLEHFLLCDNLCRRCDFHRLNFCHISYHRGLILLWHRANLRFHVHQGKLPVPDVDILDIPNSSPKSFFDEILKKGIEWAVKFWFFFNFDKLEFLCEIWILFDENSVYYINIYGRPH